MTIQWFPGHMAKTRRLIEEHVKLTDAVCEVVDARIPRASRNPELPALIGGKPRLIILNRADQADPAQTAAWAVAFRAEGLASVATDCRSGAGVAQVVPAVKVLLKERLDTLAARGQAGRPLRLLIAGIPNAGKSSLINRLAGRRAAPVEDRPGVTRGRQWYALPGGVDLLDTPGVLWPKFEDPEIGLLLAFTGAVKDDVLDIEELAALLMERLAALSPKALTDRYNIDPTAADGFSLLTDAARRRGFLVGGGEANTERMARTLLDEFRAGKLGRITLETV
ncbi:MAG: ribosome biogenesis GTPase YlqF [Oscillospiraceae bacterium]|jgi:ribosome biogenesis GTPase A|nr:ribosome biogenesis GTPase YlqF [Oscillospiraceae bacterium]